MSSEEAEHITDPPASEEPKENEAAEENPETTKEEEVEKTEEQPNEEQTSEEQSEPEADGAEAEAGEQPESEGSRKFTADDIRTAPMDFRFPTTNQARHCFTRYIEYHKCVRAKGEDDPECNKYARYYRSLCPGEWIDKWNEQRENGTFPGPL